jgi:hypothetical protein
LGQQNGYLEWKLFNTMIESQLTKKSTCAGEVYKQENNELQVCCHGGTAG